MAKVVVCPSCQAKGAIPDDAQVARIRCPKCGIVYKIGAEADTGPAQPPPVAGASRSGSGHRRVPAAAAAAPPRAPAAAAPAPAGRASNRVMLFALFGVSGLAVVLLGAVLVVLTTRGGGQGDKGTAQADATGTVAAAPSPGASEAGTAPAVPAGDLAPPQSNVPGGVAPTASTKLAGAPSPSGAPFAVSPAPATPDTARLPDEKEILRRLKDATVLINTKIGKKIIGNGSGFVIEVNGDTVLIATNRHVAVLDPSELPPGLLPRGTKPTLEAVFRSGSGQDEQALPAQIIAADLSGELSVDLAFLVVKGVTRPPKPLDPLDRIQPIEGMSYIGAGFPYAGVIKVSKNEGKPSVVVTGGRISSFKRDEFGQLLVLQVDGSLQPGNSGGPIIDEKTGKLLGLAVAKASFADTIGFIVPADELRRALRGRVGSLDLFLEPSKQQGVATLRVRAILMDPKLQVGGVVVHAAPLSKVGKLSPNSDGTWPALPNTQPTELKRNPRAAEALGRVQVALAGSGAAARKVLVQVAHRDLRGRLIYTRPKEVFLPDHPGPIRPAGSLARIASKVMGKSLAMLGPLVDPSKDCRLDKDEKSLKIRIDVPGKLHTLSPEILVRRNQPVHNAPMTLADVDGDFLAQVAVTGEINPGAKLPSDRPVRGWQFTFQSAGLVLYQDKNNFIRLERASSILIARRTPIHRLLVEVVQEGKQSIAPIYLDIPEGDTTLILSRRKGRVRCMFVPAGSGSVHTFREFALDFPSKVKVGLSAASISAQPFTATFERFALISDAMQIDRELDGE